MEVEDREARPRRARDVRTDREARSKQCRSEEEKEERGCGIRGWLQTLAVHGPFIYYVVDPY